jgi:hypothetical protein
MRLADQKRTAKTELGEGGETLGRDEVGKISRMAQGGDYDSRILAKGNLNLIRIVALSLHNSTMKDFQRPVGAINSSQRRMRGSGLRARKKRELSSTWLVFSFFFNGYISIRRAII